MVQPRLWRRLCFGKSQAVPRVQRQRQSLSRRDVGQSGVFEMRFRKNHSKNKKKTMVPGQFQVLNKLNPDKPVFPCISHLSNSYSLVPTPAGTLQLAAGVAAEGRAFLNGEAPGFARRVYRFLQVNRRKSIENLQGIAMLTYIYILYVIYIYVLYIYMLYIYMLYIYVIYCYIYIYCMLENMYVSWIMCNRMTLHFQIPSFTG